AFIADRTHGLTAGGPTPQVLVAEQKKTFTGDDVYRRARRALGLAVRHGCPTMRAHVGVDGFVEMRAVEALRRLQKDLAGVLDLQLIAFAQEGIFDEQKPTQGMLRDALRGGLENLGGAPFMDPKHQREHIDWFFETAREFGVPLDFHADSGDDVAMLTTDYIAEQTIRHRMQGRVTVGHVGMLDAMVPAHRAEVIAKLREAQVHVISLPATEMHVKGRTDAQKTWRGGTRPGEVREAGAGNWNSTGNNTNTLP